MGVPQLERKIYGLTEQKFLAGIEPKPDKINIKVPFWNLLEMQECQTQPFVFAGFFPATSFNKLFVGLGFVSVFSFFFLPSSFLATWSLPRLLWVCSSHSQETALTWKWTQAAAALLGSPASDSLGLLCGLGYLGFPNLLFFLKILIFKIISLCYC